MGDKELKDGRSSCRSAVGKQRFQLSLGVARAISLDLLQANLPSYVIGPSMLLGAPPM